MVEGKRMFLDFVRELKNIKNLDSRIKAINDIEIGVDAEYQKANMVQEKCGPTIFDTLRICAQSDYALDVFATTIETSF